jgi:hypothetical protein
MQRPDSGQMYSTRFCDLTLCAQWCRCYGYPVPLGPAAHAWGIRRKLYYLSTPALSGNIGNARRGLARISVRVSSVRARRGSADCAPGGPTPVMRTGLFGPGMRDALQAPPVNAAVSPFLPLDGSCVAYRPAVGADSRPWQAGQRLSRAGSRLSVRLRRAALRRRGSCGGRGSGPTGPPARQTRIGFPPAQHAGKRRVLAVAGHGSTRAGVQ